MAGNAFCNRCKRAKNARGITLVELSVVLVIMAILAGAGIGSAVGFIKRSRLTQNEDNANTIYQAVQTALLNMEKSGSLSAWVEKKVVADGQATPFSKTDGASNPSSNTTLESSFNETTFFDDTEPKANQSKHMRFVLTYCQAAAIVRAFQNKLIRQRIKINIVKSIPHSQSRDNIFFSDLIGDIFLYFIFVDQCCVNRLPVV